MTNRTAATPLDRREPSTSTPLDRGEGKRRELHRRLVFLANSRDLGARTTTSAHNVQDRAQTPKRGRQRWARPAVRRRSAAQLSLEKPITRGSRFATRARP